MSMLLGLVVLAMLIWRIGDPANWNWLAQGQKKGEKGEISVKSEKGEKGEKGEKAEGAEKAKPAEPAGLTDEDSEEQDEMKEARQALIGEDGTLHLKKVEMVPYEHVVKWVKNQSLARLLERARKTVLFDQFIADPEQMRFQIVRVDVKVWRVVPCDVPVAGQELYEVHGFGPEGRLYFGIVQDLPDGMPTGTDVHEQAVLVGYFFKLQGYYPENVKSRTPLKAPVIIGRLECTPSAVAERDDTPGWYWVAMAVGCVIIVVGGVVVKGVVQRRLAHGRPQHFGLPRRNLDPDAPAVDEWLDQAQTGGLPQGNNFSGNGESKSGLGSGEAEDRYEGLPPRFEGGAGIWS
jgi:hypothetical protein